MAETNKSQEIIKLYLTSVTVTKIIPTKIVKNFLLLFLPIVILSGCYHDKEKKHDALPQYSKQQLDSISFSSKHHFSRNYNFVVKKDSIVLIPQQPEEKLNDMPTDSVSIYRNEHIVVADIRIIPQDKIDSVWVQVANDKSIFGWIHESALLPAVVPNDSISQFISTFSDTHLLIFLIIISIMSVAYLMRTLRKRNARIVHFNDISSFYPTLLALTVAMSATFYSSIQVFAPEVWRHFYYHPTLNPFIVPPILAIFLISVWAMLIIAIAVIDIVRNMLPISDFILYISGLAGVCAINYIIFSITTLYFLGYPLLIVYIYFSIKTYIKHSKCTYICGSCGNRIREKGSCPFCGRINF